jgi:hypothetical protein
VPMIVSLKEIAEELDNLMHGMTAYINRDTGEVFTMSEEDFDMIEDEDFDEEDIPDWQKEDIPKMKEIVAERGWVALPDKSDIDEWQIMKRFIYSLDKEELREQLFQAIRRKGAFRNFRDAIQQLQLDNQWHEFKHLELQQIAAEALKEANIPFG